jgi:hypothetical protein
MAGTTIVLPSSKRSEPFRPNLQRSPASHLGNCDTCVNEAEDPRQLFLLLTFFNDTELTLCPQCELLLLETLLNNFVKRSKKSKLKDTVLLKEEVKT